MGSLATSGARAVQIFSQRGQTALAHGSKSIMWDIISNLWDAETNPDGYVSIGVAENALLHDTLLEYIHSDIRLTAIYLTYNDGSMGSMKLRKAVSHFLNGHLRPQLSWAFMEPGEGMLLGKPYYGTFIADISVRPSAVVIPVNFGKVNPLSPEAISQYKKAVTDFEFSTGNHVPAVMLCHPHNPLGRCYPRSAIIDLVKMCQAHQMHLISDKIYALAVWNNQIDKDVPQVPFESILSIDPAGLIDADLVHVLWGMSKDFGSNGSARRRHHFAVQS
ncbi:hypothetical protein IFM58399_07451 [Aspergillus lentulus]|uniref:uncharacterized protein n=1 Tax=Aspergillus lentulus TaxID=293939 RepID=UPI00139579B3|nr:uncharacterized protein IFM58399_07451 [Aspergillus lentulus]KAF4190015.1 hypothetical protein CNMCM7927_005825 [Aspergillus lentulus]GFF45060.1 hypothetical protein IFM58399_07451 [Aspergillus lentulus]GFG08451.1 hypothetical protein IFM61392_05375 [Aspergillus lentulus]